MPNWTFVEAHNYTFSGVDTYAVPIPQDLEIGDIIFIVFHNFVGAAANPLVLPTSNFTNISYDDEGGNEEKLIGIGSNGYNPHLLYRIVDGSEPTTATFETNILTFSNSCATVFVYRPATGFTFTGFGESELYTTDSLVKVGSTALEFTEDPINVAEESNVWALWLLGTSATTITEGTDSGTLRFANAANYATVALYDGEVTPSTNLADRKIYLSPTNTASPDAVILLKAVFTERPTPVKHSFSESVGSLLDSVSVVPSDTSLKESFFPDVALDLDTQKGFYHFLRPDTPLINYYPRPVNSFELLSEYRGESKLKRMERSYPSPILKTALQTSYATATITPQQAVTELFTAFKTEFPWFTFEAVPDLRVHRADRDYSGTNGQLSLAAIIFPQEEPRKSMAQITDEMLSIFAQTEYRENSSGNIEIVAAIGPDAPTITKTIALTDVRLGGASEGKPDPTGVFNAATGTSSGIEAVTDDFVMNASWFAVKDANFYDGDSTKWFSEPGDRDILNPGASRYSAADLEPWKLADGVLIQDGQTLSFTDPSDSSSLITARYRHTASLGDFEEGDATVKNVADLTLNGGWQRICTVEFIQTFTDFGFDVFARSDLANRQVLLEVRSQKTHDDLYGAVVPTLGDIYAMFEVYIEGVANVFRYTEKSVKASFGIDLDSDELPNADGTDLLAASQAKYGRIEAQLTNTIFPISSGQLALILQGFVLANINPRLTKTIALSQWDPVKFEPDDIGHPTQLWDGQEGIIQAYNYEASHQTQGTLIDSLEFVYRDASDTTVVLPDDEENDCYLFTQDGEYIYAQDGDFILPQVCETTTPATAPSSAPPTKPSGPYDHTVDSLAELAALTVLPGQSVFVNSGTDSTSITPARGQTLSFQGTSGSRISIVFHDDYIVSGSGIAVSSESRIYIKDCEYVDWWGCQAHDMPDYAFFLEGNDNCTFNGLYSLRSYLTGVFFWRNNTDCEVHDSQVYGSYQGGDADGFAVSQSSNNTVDFYDCISENNSDDGFDAWQATGVSFTRCEAGYNGTSYSGTKGDGNGFKLGSITTPGSGGVTVTDCKSFENDANGFDYNGSSKALAISGSTAWKNKGSNFVLDDPATTSGCRSSNGSDDTSGSSGSGITATDESTFLSLDRNNANFLEV